MNLAKEMADKKSASVNCKSTIAKNIILFIGDGMVTSVTAARIYRGQLENRENNQDPLFWESFSYGGLVKTYSLDMHVTDSAAAAVAILSGQKVNAHTLGLDGDVVEGACTSEKGHKVETLASKLLKSGKSVGFVTTSRVTHATPAALYAHTANRWVESDLDKRNVNITGYGCIDIAQQLIDEFPGNQLKVILGGGRMKMINLTYTDVENGNIRGERLNGRITGRIPNMFGIGNNY